MLAQTVCCLSCVADEPKAHTPVTSHVLYSTVGNMGALGSASHEAAAKVSAKARGIPAFSGDQITPERLHDGSQSWRHRRAAHSP